MDFQCELCNGKQSYEPDPGNTNARPDNWHRWKFVDDNSEIHRISICPKCTNALRQDFHFSTEIKISELKNKLWLEDLLLKIESYIKLKQAT